MPLTFLASSRGRAANIACSDDEDLPGVMFMLRHIFGLGFFGFFFLLHAHGEKASISWFEIGYLLIPAPSWMLIVVGGSGRGRIIV